MIATAVEYESGWWCLVLVSPDGSVEYWGLVSDFDDMRDELDQADVDSLLEEIGYTSLEHLLSDEEAMYALEHGK